MLVLVTKAQSALASPETIEVVKSSNVATLPTKLAELTVSAARLTRI